MKQSTFEWFATVEVKTKAGSKRSAKASKGYSVGITPSMPIMVMDHVAIGGGK